jgi:hypothetical protein
LNDYGASDFSEELSAGVGDFPSQGNPVQIKTRGVSDITLEWDEISNTELPVLGYILKINDGLGGD